jgi:hypothetical protein
MARYTVVLDACVLVPIALADTLLRIAEHGLYGRCGQNASWTRRPMRSTRSTQTSPSGPSTAGSAP